MQRIYKIKNFIISEDFLILNGDAIFDANLNEIFKKHLLKERISLYVVKQRQILEL